MKELVVVHVEPINITFDSKTWEKGGEIICEVCEEEYAEHQVEFGFVGSLNFKNYCHGCFCDEFPNLEIEVNV